jgi:hypothetical protein
MNCLNHVDFFALDSKPTGHFLSIFTLMYGHHLLAKLHNTKICELQDRIKCKKDCVGKYISSNLVEKIELPLSH